MSGRTSWSPFRTEMTFEAEKSSCYGELERPSGSLLGADSAQLRSRSGEIDPRAVLGGSKRNSRISSSFISKS